jgi:hypothetical protein
VSSPPRVAEADSAPSPVLAVSDTFALAVLDAAKVLAPDSWEERATLIARELRFAATWTAEEMFGLQQITLIAHARHLTVAFEGAVACAFQDDHIVRLLLPSFAPVIVTKESKINWLAKSAGGRILRHVGVLALRGPSGLLMALAMVASYVFSVLYMAGVVSESTFPAVFALTCFSGVGILIFCSLLDAVILRLILQRFDWYYLTCSNLLVIVGGLVLLGRWEDRVLFTGARLGMNFGLLVDALPWTPGWHKTILYSILTISQIATMLGFSLGWFVLRDAGSVIHGVDLSYVSLCFFGLFVLMVWSARIVYLSIFAPAEMRLLVGVAYVRVDPRVAKTIMAMHDVATRTRLPASTRRGVTGRQSQESGGAPCLPTRHKDLAAAAAAAASRQPNPSTRGCIGGRAASD